MATDIFEIDEKISNLLRANELTRARLKTLAKDMDATLQDDIMADAALRATDANLKTYVAIWADLQREANIITVLRQLILLTGYPGPEEEEGEPVTARASCEAEEDKESMETNGSGEDTSDKVELPAQTESPSSEEKSVSTPVRASELEEWEALERKGIARGILNDYSGECFLAARAGGPNYTPSAIANDLIAIGKELRAKNPDRAAWAAMCAFCVHPTPGLLKWLGFRLRDAGDYPFADAWLACLPANTKMSDSEKRHWAIITADALAFYEKLGAMEAGRECWKRDKRFIMAKMAYICQIHAQMLMELQEGVKPTFLAELGHCWQTMDQRRQFYKLAGKNAELGGELEGMAARNAAMEATLLDRANLADLLSLGNRELQILLWQARSEIADLRARLAVGN